MGTKTPLRRVLAGQQPYDTLDATDQATVRAAWDTRIDQARDALNFEDEFTRAGDTWTEADQHGRLVHRHP